MKLRIGLALAVLVACLTWAQSARAAGVPSGEVTLGRTSIEPAYDDMTGKLIYLLTPIGAPFPSVSNPKSWAPLYLIVYPNTAANAVGTMNCQHDGGDNCPDHGPEIAGAAMAVNPNGVYDNGVWGHDHLVDAPGGSDFNIAWEVHVLLFTNAAAAMTHVTTEEEMDQLLASHDLIDLGPGVTFNCSVVSGATYKRGTPVTPVN